MPIQPTEHALLAQQRERRHYCRIADHQAKKQQAAHDPAELGLGNIHLGSCGLFDARMRPQYGYSPIGSGVCSITLTAFHSAMA